MLEPPRSQRGWILLIIAVLVASTVVTAALAAVLVAILFPNGFLVDVEADPGQPRAEISSADTHEPASPGFGLSASVTCSVSFGDLGELRRPD